MDTRGRESGEGNQVKVLKKRKLPLVRQIRIRKVTYLMTIVNTAV